MNWPQEPFTFILPCDVKAGTEIVVENKSDELIAIRSSGKETIIERGTGKTFKKEATNMLTIEALADANAARCRSGFGHSLKSWSLLEWAGATAGEIGEACNVAKKIIRVRDGIRGNKREDNLSALRAKFGQELADGIIYAVLAMLAAGLNPEDEIRKTFNNKSIEIGSEIKI